MTRKKKGRAIHGVLLINKPSGASSNGVLQRVKWLMQAQKAGHTGALDPLATGLLPLCFGEATKFSQMLLDSDKSYLTTAKLGVVTDSADADGKTVETREVGEYTLEQVQALLDQHFKGDIRQAAPIFSALKVNGVPMYELARKGIAVEAKVRDAHIFEARAISINGDEIELSYRVSKGTYIRSLVADLGQMLGCGAHVAKLHRTSHGPWSIEQAFDWSNFESDDAFDQSVIDNGLLAVDNALAFIGKIDVTDNQAKRISHGNPVTLHKEYALGEIRIYHGDKFLGLGKIEPSKEGKIQLNPYRVLNIQDGDLLGS
jgi:tRNA pseudouridine55 synthase